MGFWRLSQAATAVHHLVRIGACHHVFQVQLFSDSHLSTWLPQKWVLCVTWTSGTVFAEQAVSSGSANDLEKYGSHRIISVYSYDWNAPDCWHWSISSTIGLQVKTLDMTPCILRSTLNSPGMVIKRDEVKLKQMGASSSCTKLFPAALTWLVWREEQLI